MCHLWQNWSTYILLWDYYCVFVEVPMAYIETIYPVLTSASFEILTKVFQIKILQTVFLRMSIFINCGSDNIQVYNVMFVWRIPIYRDILSASRHNSSADWVDQCWLSWLTSFFGIQPPESKSPLFFMIVSEWEIGSKLRIDWVTFVTVLIVYHLHPNDRLGLFCWAELRQIIICKQTPTFFSLIQQKRTVACSYCIWLIFLMKKDK